MIIITTIHLITALLVFFVLIICVKNILVTSSSDSSINANDKETIVHNLINELDLGLDVVKLLIISALVMISMLLFKHQSLPDFFDTLLGIVIIVTAIESLYYILKFKLSNHKIVFFKIVTTIILSGIYGWFLEF
ncbi:hypothetical protein BM74_16850 [Bacillus thuringiensis]|uniref:Uncharacterized protein n=1 Tax=Bacillus thuringiensis TaxID=1428 RepID=A0A437SJF8_BACTU|nr:hypothetical protein [Bacillus thuringiensis]RVU63127.1 hypothetical protein BM74_16850 [Bacillus thuringiensis]